MSSAIAFIVVLIIYSHAYQYLWESGIVNLMPGYWYAGVCLLGFLGWITASRALRPDPSYSGFIHKKSQKYLLAWALAFAILAVLSYLGSARAPEQLRALKTVIVCVGLFGVFLATFNGKKQVAAARNAMLCVVLWSVIINFVDFLGISTFSITPGRAAGMYVNPNLAGFYLVIGMILTTPVVPRWLRLYYGIFVGMGVALTFSRAGVLMWLVAMFGLSQLGLYRMSRKRVTALLAAVIAVAMLFQFRVSVVEMFGLEQYLSADAVQRLHLDYKSDESLKGRVAVAERSWELIREAPIVGHGLGSHETWRTRVEPHNMFLLLGVEMGLLGVIAYVSLLALIWRLGMGLPRVFAAALFVGAMFSHNLLEYSAIWLAYAVLAGTAALVPPGMPVSRTSPRLPGVGQSVRTPGAAFRDPRAARQ